MANCLELNVVKTKELVIDFRSGVHHPIPVNMNGQNKAIVCIPIHIWVQQSMTTLNQYKKGQQRLYFLRKLNALHIDRNILFVFHDSFVKSVMTFGLVCWWGNLSVKNREKLNRIYTLSCKIAMCCTPDISLEQLYMSRTLQMATKILCDPTHFLHDCYELLPSGRRYRMPTVKTHHHAVGREATKTASIT